MYSLNIYYTFRYICKALDVINGISGSFKQVDWRFQNINTKWYQICSKFDVNWPSIGGRTSMQLESQLKVIQCVKVFIYIM